MKRTKHVTARCAQRGIPEPCVDLVMQYGTASMRPGDAYAYTISRKQRDRIIRELRGFIKSLERSSDTVVVASEDGAVITTYHNSNIRRSVPS